MRKGRLFSRVGGTFGLVGVVLLGVAVTFAVMTVGFHASAERTDGRVVELKERTSSSSRSTVWYPTVEYTVDGRVYSFDSSFASSPPAYAEGDTVPVAYDPGNPADARLVTSMAWFPVAVTGGLGAVFTPIGVVLFVTGRRVLRQRAWLLEHGREVWAQITAVDVAPNVKINGRRPYVLRATWQDPSTGGTHTATSDYLRHDPGPALLGRTHVRVLYDVADPDRILVDLDSVR